MDQQLLYTLLAASAAVGFFLGWALTRGGWRLPVFQNRGEARVSRELTAQFGPPDYHLLNHVTLPMRDCTTQVDHILVSRFGVFVIETKDYAGWVFANEADRKWTQVIFRQRFTFQNPLLQNFRHVRAVQELLDFLPPGAIISVVVFTGDAEFKTDVPPGVVLFDKLAEYVRTHSTHVMSLNRLQFCVGRLETARLAISGETDLEHVQNLARRFRGGGV